jgi:hypothetical protein
MERTVAIAALPRRPVRSPASRTGGVQILAIAVHGTVLLVLLALMAASVLGVPIDDRTLLLLACETIVLPALVGLALAGVPRCSRASALRGGMSLWAVAQAACVPFTPWPVLLLTASASLLGFVLVGGLLTGGARASAPRRVIRIAVEPAFLPTRGRLGPPASA